MSYSVDIIYCSQRPAIYYIRMHPIAMSVLVAVGRGVLGTLAVLRVLFEPISSGVSEATPHCQVV